MTATVLLVFGRGVTEDGGRYALTPAGAARVDAAVGYVAAHTDAFAGAAAPLVVFSGGWAEASEGAPRPPEGCREGDLMLARARAAGLGAHADLRTECRSRSTLENLLHTVEDGLLDGHTFGRGHPLGLVSHAWHLPRIRFLARKVLHLRGAALLDVPATAGEPSPGRERALHVASRLWFMGVADPAGLLRRERAMVASLRRRPAG
ncbi:ElyC/SanA/YdcF family protein [Dactylosporangium sp. NPDC005555]|uniref:ElyC/SanA/YdcF family protein n=1 Tax=Dactylosporangium sp. NPDC005555 TaxID=3154889 RepID=UPI0033AEABD1